MHRTPSSMGVSVKLFIHGELNGLRDLSWVIPRVQTELEGISYNPQHNEHSENPVGSIAGVRPLKGIQGHHLSDHGCAGNPGASLQGSGLCRVSSGIIAVFRAMQSIQWQHCRDRAVNNTQGQHCRDWAITEHPVTADSIIGVGPLESTNTLLR